MLKEILINPINNFVKEENNKKYIIICDNLRKNFDKYLLSLNKKEYAPAFIVQITLTSIKLINLQFTLH